MHIIYIMNSDQDSNYYKLDTIKNIINNKKYVKGSIIGGLWDDIGELQLNFLIKNGLKENHKLLDIGCGELRGGVKFIDYLMPYNYYGTDISKDLINNGLKYLNELDLINKINKNTFIINSDFNFDKFDVKFDYIIAQSVFTHLKIDKLKMCLQNVEKKLKKNGKFYCTFFENKTKTIYSIKHYPGNITTYPNKDPYHYHVDALINCADNTKWKTIYIGNWNHPRNQQMLLFIKKCVERDSENIQKNNERRTKKQAKIEEAIYRTKMMAEKVRRRRRLLWRFPVRQSQRRGLFLYGR